MRAWLEGAGRRIDSSARKRRRCSGRTSPTVTIPSRSRKVESADPFKTLAWFVANVGRRKEIVKEVRFLKQSDAEDQGYTGRRHFNERIYPRVLGAHDASPQVSSSAGVASALMDA